MSAVTAKTLPASPVAAQRDWISMHVYIHDFARLNHFIRECLGVLPMPILSGCFFIRYWVGGPHVRLRFRAEGARALIEDEVHRYLARHAFESVLDPERFYPVYESYREAEPERYWCPNGSVQYIAYQPEPERYGGAAGLEACEDFFTWDSSLITNVLRQQPETAYPAIALGYCLVHLRVLRQRGLHRASLEILYRMPLGCDIAAFVRQGLGCGPGALPPAVLATGARFHDNDLYQEYLPLLHVQLHLLVQQLEGRGVGDIPRILDALLHMSFNRIGIGPRRERAVKLVALYLENESHETAATSN